MRPPTNVLVLLVAAPLALVACTADGGGRGERGPLGKADSIGTCSGACGAQSAAGDCWCDSQCTGIGDCCSDFAQECPALDGGALPDGGGGTPDGAILDDAMSSGVVLSYSFGNQIVGSTLTIFDTGAVVHSERVCCPPTTDTVDDVVDATTLSALQADVAAVAAAGTTATIGGPSCLGCKSGEVTVFNGGQEHVVKAIHGDLGDDQIVITSDAPEATDILALVRGMVDVDIP